MLLHQGYSCGNNNKAYMCHLPLVDFKAWCKVHGLRSANTRDLAGSTLVSSFVCVVEVLPCRHVTGYQELFTFLSGAKSLIIAFFWRSRML